MGKGFVLLFDKYRLNLLIILPLPLISENKTVKNAFAELSLLTLISIKANIVRSLNIIID